jgi:flagellar hook assembly protein FlgD
MSGFEWDGKTDLGGTAPSGAYVFKVTAARGTTTIPAEPMTSGRVGGISLGGAGGTTLNLLGGGDISMNAIKRIL